MKVDASMDAVMEKVWEGQRMNAAETAQLYQLPLEVLGSLAHRRRELAKAEAYDGRGNEIITYNVDRNINYTNVCNVYCKFCAFYRTAKDEDAYVITKEELDQKIEETVALGGNQILMQGGHHPSLTLDWYLDMLSHIKKEFPQVNIHAFSPSEFIHFQKVFDLPMEDLLRQFKEAGLGSIPGGGGEILVDRVRQRIAPLKAMSDEWLGVMDVAHRMGLNSSTMMRSCETLEDGLTLTSNSTYRGSRLHAWTFNPKTPTKAKPLALIRACGPEPIYQTTFPAFKVPGHAGPEVGQVALTYGAMIGKYHDRGECGRRQARPFR